MNDEFLIDDIFIDDIENFQNQRATPEGDKAASAFRQPPEGSEPASLLPSTLLPTKEDHISNQQVVTSQGYHPSTVSSTVMPRDTTNPWDPRLLLDLALAVDPLEDILTRYSLTAFHCSMNAWIRSVFPTSHTRSFCSNVVKLSGFISR